MDVRTLLLGILTQRNATGYELKKLLEGPLRQFFDASYGSIYPALSRLADENLVKFEAQAQARRPEKKVYRITPQGRLAFMDALQAPVGRDRVKSEFVATLVFADLLPARRLAELIDARLAEAEATARTLDAALADLPSEGARFIAGLAAATLAAERAYLEENRHKLEGAALLADAPGAKRA